MSPRTGRPPKVDAKNVRIQIRADKDTIKKLDLCAEYENTTRSEIVRRGIEEVYAKIKK